MNITRNKQMDGRLFYYCFLAGAGKIVENQREINRINVFPVPDGDTGTNLAFTVRAVVEKVKPKKSFMETVSEMASASLDGAQGNSGVIFTQFLYGIANEAKNDSSVDTAKFATILKNCVPYIYQAIAKPVEGTMLTVIKDWVEYIHENAQKNDDFLALLESSYNIAKKSLAETTNQLAVLKQSNVVDAGGLGVVVFIEGMVEFLKHRKLRRLLKENLDLVTIDAESNVDAVSEDALNQRFCTEATVTGEELSNTGIRDELNALGDSLVIAGSKNKLRVHIHTNVPYQVAGVLRKSGNVVTQKSEDMVRQYESIHKRKWNIAVVTDSTCDLPNDLMEYYQINIVPIIINFGENSYLDKHTISSGQFYNMLEEGRDFPTTSQPKTSSFHNLYSQLIAHYDSIIAVHISSKFSGTFDTSTKVAKKITEQTGKKISVLDSRSISGGLGLIALNIAKAIESGIPHDDIVAKTEEWVAKTRVFVAVRTFKYMVKGGRVSPMKGFVANLLNLKPVVSMQSDGTSVMLDKAFSQKGLMKKILSTTEKYYRQNKFAEYVVMHAQNPDEANEFASQVESKVGKKPLCVIDTTPVLGVHTGKDAIFVSFMME